MEEVNQYEKALLDKPRITVLNKIDAFGEDERKLYKEQLINLLQRFKAKCQIKVALKNGKRELAKQKQKE